MLNIQSIQRSSWNRLLAMRSRLPHALLLSGVDGTGKLALAEAFAASLLCESPLGDGRHCGACEACRWHSQGNHPDFRYLRPSVLAPDEEEVPDRKLSKEILVDQVRALEDFLRVGGHRRGLRVVLVYPADAMNRNTANAMLKTLEEPGDSLIYILLTSRADELLPTIRSRCQRVEVPRPETPAALEWLASAGVKDPLRWLALAGGAPLAAKSLADGDAGALLAVWLPSLRAGDSIDALGGAMQAETLIGKDKRVVAGPRTLVDWMQRWIHDLLLVGTVPTPRYFPLEAETLQKLQLRVSRTKALSFGRSLAELKALSEHSLNTRLFLFEMLSQYRLIFGSEGGRHGR